MPDATSFFFDPGGNIWHETGLLSVAAGRPGIRTLNAADFETALRAGALGVLSDGDWPNVLPAIEHNVPAADLETRDWWRWRRAFQVPSAADLLRVGGREQPGWREQNQREYKLVWIKGADER